MRGFPWILLLVAAPVAAAEIHVSPTGDDGNSGTAERPLRTFAAAQQAARKMNAQTVLFHAGTYYLPEPIVITPEDSGTTYAAAPGETVVLSGGSKLDLQWQPFRDGIVQARTPDGLAIDQLFVNGRRQHRARYPNFDPDARPYHGAAADAFSPQRAARWADPVGGFIHAMHRAHWGGYHYRITGKNENTRSYQQNGNRGPQRYVLFGSDAAADPGWNVEDRTKFTPVAEVDATSVAVRRFLATSIRRSASRPLGAFRWLVWVVYPVTEIDENTAYQELQIRAAGDSLR